jgi:hypothetical protein
MMQKLTGEHQEEVPEDSLVPSHPRRVCWVPLLDRLVGDGGNLFL